jgi:hypothetical protein
MKDYFAEQITERPRSGRRYKTPKGSNRRWQYCDLDEQPKKEKIRQKWQDGQEKSLTDVIGPLYGYLRKNVGCHWDDVYSEICENLPINSLQGIHIRQHVEWAVEKNVVIINGVVCYGEGRMYGNPISSNKDTFYVHPDTGILCKAATAKKFKYAPSKGKGIVVDDTHQYHCINGVWYLVTIGPWKSDPQTYWRKEYDVVYKVYLSEWECFDYYGKKYIGVSKGQLNKKEIRKAGLSKTA